MYARDYATGDVIEIEGLRLRFLEGPRGEKRLGFERLSGNRDRFECRQYRGSIELERGVRQQRGFRVQGSGPDQR